MDDYLGYPPDADEDEMLDHVIGKPWDDPNANVIEDIKKAWRDVYRGRNKHYSHHHVSISSHTTMPAIDLNAPAHPRNWAWMIRKKG